MKGLSRSPEWYKSRMDSIKRSNDRKSPKVKEKIKPKYFTGVGKISERVWKDWKKYQFVARMLTKEVDVSGIENIHLRDGVNYQLDHIVSVWDGYLNNIPPKLIASIDNLRVITTTENKLKGKLSIPDALTEMLKRKNDLFERENNTEPIQ